MRKHGKGEKSRLGTNEINMQPLEERCTISSNRCFVNADIDR